MERQKKVCIQDVQCHAKPSSNAISVWLQRNQVEMVVVCSEYELSNMPWKSMEPGGTRPLMVQTFLIIE